MVADGLLQEGTERTESHQPVDSFGLLQKETKVTKTHSRSRYALRSLGYLLFKSLVPEFSADFADGRGWIFTGGNGEKGETCQ